LYPPTPPTIFFIRADNYAVGEENEAMKVKNPRVITERNSVSDKIVNVRENARFIPLREKWLAESERISLEKGRFSPGKEPF
jgi:hypothetical protein